MILSSISRILLISRRFLSELSCAGFRFIKEEFLGSESITRKLAEEEFTGVVLLECRVNLFGGLVYLWICDEKKLRISIYFIVDIYFLSFRLFDVILSILRKYLRVLSLKPILELDTSGIMLLIIRYLQMSLSRLRASDI